MTFDPPKIKKTLSGSEYLETPYYFTQFGRVYFDSNEQKLKPYGNHGELAYKELFPNAPSPEMIANVERKVKGISQGSFLYVKRIHTYRPTNIFIKFFFWLFRISPSTKAEVVDAKGKSYSIVVKKIGDLSNKELSKSGSHTTSRWAQMRLIVGIAENAHIEDSYAIDLNSAYAKTKSATRDKTKKLFTYYKGKLPTTPPDVLRHIAITDDNRDSVEKITRLVVQYLLNQ